MTIAIFSDVHANLPALEAFFEDVKQYGPDAIYCLGDLIGYNIWPNEVIAELRKRKIATIAGNHDIKVKGSKPGAEKSAKSYAYDIINELSKEYLDALPAHLRVTFQLNGDQLTLLLVHGSPRSINEYLYEETDLDTMTSIFTEENADIICFGHTHKPYHRVIPINHAKGKRFAHAINTGSVGKPKDGDSRGSYVLIRINENSSGTDINGVDVEIKRFVYDVAVAAAAIENSPLANELADMLRKAY
ncbi:metallophosphoesterase family protein [Chitinophaga rhizophila]|uniref:Metallophosphatase family protein n=1 Tax=Chitinophaga rhizophila TaxID=2866212 RepID=A0ABS7G6P0_9BACT|nr:metallophosphoesterase family protein [Chitinophaga rhizophila]MBW8682835.1 metallophosphatase family protein [Chitinophaga rhizophila]